MVALNACKDGILSSLLMEMIQLSVKCLSVIL